MPTKDQLTAEVINEVLSILRGTKNFVLEELPDVVQQILKWAVAESILFILLGLGLTAVAVFLFKYSKRTEDEEKQWPGDENMFAQLGAALCIMAGPLMSVINIFGLVKVLVAPKIYLIEYFTMLLRTKG